MRLDTTIVPAAMAEQCKEIGVHFAVVEFGNFQDAGRTRRDWTRGTFEGDSLPVERPRHDADDYDAQDAQDAQDALYCACEQIMDDAACAEWERLWNEARVAG